MAGILHCFIIKIISMFFYLQCPKECDGGDFIRTASCNAVTFIWKCQLGWTSLHQTSDLGDLLLPTMLGEKYILFYFIK